MEENNISISVYELTTKLCERFVNLRMPNVSNKSVKKLRSKAYEVLLSKTVPQSDNILQLENVNDPFCHLLAWQFVLINDYGLSDHANKLRDCAEILQKTNTFPDTLLKSILTVLVQLKQVPDDVYIKRASSTYSSHNNLSKPSFRQFDELDFKLPFPIICTGSKFSDESFYLKTKFNKRQYRTSHVFCFDSHFQKSQCKTCAMYPDRISCKSSENLIKQNEKSLYLIPDDEEVNIWELISNTKFTGHRTWESLGDPCPEPEPPFLTEAKPNVCNLTYNMQFLQLNLLKEQILNPRKIIPQREFIKHIKYLLVGMPSDSFKYNSIKEQFELVPGISIEDIPCASIESYCKDLLFCGNCYKALNEMCAFNQTMVENNRGFIFKELCESIKRYLSYYRISVQLISETNTLLIVHAHMKKLLNHLDILASVCKVGPFTESEQLPVGVALLNYLYEKVMSRSNKDVIMVLYSVLYPCVQVYFSRFLQQWIFEGTVNDPFNEFFVYSTQKYLGTRGRTYWTRSYKIQEDVVPEFLNDLCNDIFVCGKAMNLLKCCAPSSTLCVYLMGKKPALLSCCLSTDQLKKLEQNATCYYLEVIAECGQKFSLADIVSRSEEQQIIFLDQVTKKRAATLKRLTLEKLKKVQEESERKRRRAAELKAQYDLVLQEKKTQMVEEIQREMKINEVNLHMENLREKIIQEEAKELIKYYDNLFDVLEQKRVQIENNTRKLKTMTFDLSTSKISPRNIYKSNAKPDVSVANNETKEMSSPEGTLVITSDSPSNCEEVIVDTEESPISESLDIINANSEVCENFHKKMAPPEKLSNVAHLAAENFEAARRNKAKVMSVEMGLKMYDEQTQKPKKIVSSLYTEMSALQKNRLKMMQSEFGIEVKMDVKLESNLTIAEINKRKNMAHTKFGENIQNDNFKDFINKEIITQNFHKNKISLITEYDNNNKTSTLIITNCDNENFINSNISEKSNTDNKNKVDESVKDLLIKNEEVEVNGNISVTENYENNKIETVKSKVDLKLDFSKIKQPSIFSKFFKSPNFELDKPVPMSIDSTPCTDIMSSSLKIDSQATTAATNFTDEGFTFVDTETERKPILCSSIQDRNLIEKTLISKRIDTKDAAMVPTICLKLFIQQSISVPVKTQTELVNSELLRYFIKDLQYLVHLNSLRNYFFLLDGEFGRNITEGLFEKLYDANFPVDLINARTLCHLVYRAIDSSIKLQETSNCLSFKINKLPNTFDLGSPDVLDCLSLTYKVNWPLNILLPSDTIGKYDEVFKFLLKLHRVSWVLKKIFQELKILAKKTGKREPFLMLSPQFQKLHQCRHVMTHFIQTLQNYVVGEVLQTSWSIFEKKLVSVTNLDELYSLHTIYVKDILFMCLLNQKSASLRKLIHKIFVVILKFYDYLRAKEWQFEEEDGVYIHPNYKKLEDIFLNFEEFVIYLYKAGQKVAKVGFQPHLLQLLDMLNINNYYTKKNTSC